MSDNYTWIISQKVNSLHISYNDHAANYVDAKTWIEQYQPDWFKDTPAALLKAMKQTNSIWALQVYPDTPVGFYVWHGPTLDSVIEQARAWLK